MAIKKNLSDWKTIKITVNMWVYHNRLKVYADNNGMSIRTAIRYIINQFLKEHT